jgi:hypothetical protein
MLVIHDIDAVAFVTQSHVGVHVLLEAIEGLHSLGLGTQGSFEVVCDVGW